MGNKIKRENFIKKLKQQSKPLLIISGIIGFSYFISLVFFTKSLLSLSGIETALRVILIICLFLILFAYKLLGLVLLFTHRNKRLITLIIFIGLLSPILSITSYYIDKTYGIIDNVQKKYSVYTSYMISLKDMEKFDKIGIISSVDDPTGYIIPKEMIKKYSIKGELVEYDDYISMMSDLYDGEIDALFVADNYVTMFNTYEKFTQIEYETKVIYELSKKLENTDKVSYTTKDLTEPFTMLILGVDATGDGLSKGASFNGDTLMLITFNPKTLSATIFSIPRDTYVPISCMGNKEGKINSSAYGGTTCVVNTIQNLTGINIDYYMKINFTGVVKLVDDLGGIYVDVPVKFCEQDSERRIGEYQICLDKGYQLLNGEQALALSRHRHSLPLGDFQRVQHQQLVVEAMAASLKNIKDLDTFYTILSDVTNNLDTNMTTPQILSLYKVAKNILTNKLGTDTKLSIQKTYLTGYDLTMYLPSTKGYVYTFQYYRKSLEDIVNAMKVNLELIKPELIKTFSFSVNEPYELSVAGKTYYNETRRELLPNFIGQNKSYSDAWANERGKTVNYTEITEGNALYNASYQDGTIVAQSDHAGTLVESINNLTLSIIKKSNNTATVTTPAKTDEEKKDNTEEKKEEEILPNFIGMTTTEFNEWKNNLQDVSIVVDLIPLNADDILEMSETDIKADTIYKQTPSKGTKLSDISSIKVYYYKEQ